ncbi:MAG: MFS transporter [Armatimonadetes bacterium]|nr:MFS transporter [Armatimonadota bacterium]
MAPGAGEGTSPTFAIPALRAFRHRDFRLLWLGAFLSFTGSMVQNVAQGYLVFDLTHDSAKLAMVTFALMLPISVFGPILGVVSDMFDKRKTLVVCMIVSAIGPLMLGWASFTGRLQYWQFLVVAAVSGFVTCVEVPTRQSIVRTVVDEQDLSVAIPAQAATFNLARVVGPALGGIIAAKFGSAHCFVANGISFFALAIAALVIRADLRPLVARVEPIRDLIAEGVRYTMQHPSLRTLFILESATSVLGSFYLSLMAAIAKEQLGLDQQGLGIASSFVGIGAFIGIVTLAVLSARPIKAFLVRSSMTAMAIGIVLLGFTKSPGIAYGLFALTGASTIIQFNTTNTLFQLTSPPNLRGRVISMHMWAISGLAPAGVFAFGIISEWRGIPIALWTGGGLLLLAAAWGWSQRSKIEEPLLVEVAGAA